MVYDIPAPQQILVDQCVILDSKSSQYRDKGETLDPMCSEPILSYLGFIFFLCRPSCLCWLESEALSPRL